MKRIEVVTSVKNGQIKRNRNLILDLIKSFEGKEFILTFDKLRRKRSLHQNNYYWGVVVPIWQKLIRDEWGEIWDKEKTHDFLTMNFNHAEKVNENTGEIVRVPKGTSENSTSEQEDYHEVCRQKALEFFNTIIPLPNEQITID